jgi:hypothetical protein
MSESPKPSPRLVQLDRILSLSSSIAAGRGTGDRNHLILNAVPLERIQALTLELKQRPAADADDFDHLAMRVLLNEYRAAVGSLRSVTTDVDARLHDAARRLATHQKALHREEKTAVKRGDR